MIIQHNIPAINAQRNKANNGNALAKNLEKLSSGYRINRAADDAAGLAISEKMRAQVTGLSQAANNAEDGISLIQTAEGAMQEIHSMMNRMMSLSVQSANGTYSSANRAAMQKEIDQLLEEITRIEEATNFNGIPILQGSEAEIVKPPAAEIKGGLPSWVTTPQLTSDAEGSMSGEYITSEDWTSAAGSVAAGTYQMPHAAAYLDFSGLTQQNATDLLKEDTGFYSTCCTCSAHYSIKFTDETASSMETSGNHYIYKIGIKKDDGSYVDGEELVDRIIRATDGGNPNSHYTMLTANLPDKPAELIVYDERSKEPKPADVPEDAVWTDWRWQNFNVYPYGDYGVFGKGVAYKYEATTEVMGDISLHVGETGQDHHQIKIDLPDMHLSKIGISGLSIDPAENAKKAISIIGDGIDYVSSERGRMGAYQNRLEHTINNLGVQNENITSAESRIRDVDMAKEMMAYTKNDILGQASQAMLAQANMIPQGVLQLLQ